MVPMWGWQTCHTVTGRTLNGLQLYAVYYRKGRGKQNGRYILLTRAQWELISLRWWLRDIHHAHYIKGVR